MAILQVPIEHAEEVKRFLISNGLYDNRYLAKRQDKVILFPITKKDPIINLPYVSYKSGKLEEISKEKDYKSILKGKLTTKEYDELPSSFDIIGDIIILQVPDSLVKKEKLIAETLLNVHTGIRTILKRSGVHEGEFRTQALDYLAGEKKKETIYKENNIRIKLDVEKVYFSPRLSTERKRIYQEIKKGEDILVMFSGSGIYPIVISKNTQAGKIVGIEKNPVAHKYALENLKLNKTTNVELFQGDVLDIVPSLKQKYDRILMPLPKGAEDFLECAFKAAKKNTIIHFYDFEHESELNKGEEKVKNACKKSNIKFKILITVKCGQYSPGKFRICVDFQTG